MTSHVIDIYQSYIGEHQRQHLATSTIPVDASINTAPDQREYALMKRIAATRSATPQLEGSFRAPPVPGFAQPAPRGGEESLGRPGASFTGTAWGLVSWKFERKCGRSLDDFRAFATQQLQAGAECVFVNPMIGHQAFHANVWSQGIEAHPPMAPIVQFLQQKIGLSPNELQADTCFGFCNYFIATPRFWASYFDFVDHVLRLLTDEARRGTAVGTAFLSTAGYAPDPAARMAPFVTERLFSTFVERAWPASVAVWAPDERCATRKFGATLRDCFLHLMRLKHAAIASGHPQDRRQWEAACDGVPPAMRERMLSLDDPTQSPAWQLPWDSAGETR